MIDTTSLTIRRFEPEDGEDLYSYLSLPEIYRFEPGRPITEMSARELAEQRALEQEFWAVVRKKDHRMIGHLYFARLAPL